MEKMQVAKQMLFGKVQEASRAESQKMQEDNKKLLEPKTKNLWLMYEKLLEPKTKNF